MVMITLTWDMNSTVDTLEKYYSILCYIKCLPKHQDHVQIDMMCGERKTPNIKYADVFQVRDKFLKLKNENSHEVVLFNESNQITEGLSCNFFCFLNNTLYTAKDELVLKGTIREQIINLCERENIKLKKDFIDIKRYSQIRIFIYMFNN
ncbi:hypothetical protein PFMG_00060 [Plasmodium falciparum IGH-CR14]|uniref:Uncharacterized protein n=1 Tax=Plasmodium falciparum IGH-CR14 TaxID=580059 RepID=A0A0L1I3B7_PLAFA|nr:hypothetical protein PFMG_00060 [Plasmodium falciparum IGH-CR14]